MQAYCLVCKKATDNANSRVVKIKSGNINGWRSTGIHNDGSSTDLSAIPNLTSAVSKLLNQNNRLGVTFAGNLLKQARIAYNHGAIINIYIVYKLQKRNNNNADMTLENSLFGTAKITKNVDTRKYQYSGYGISFNSGGSFSFGNNLNAKNVIIFGCEMSFSSHKTYQANNVYILGKGFVQGINGTTLYAEKMCKTDFTEQNKKFVLSLHYNGDNSYLFANGVEQLRFKTKNSEIVRNLLCLGNISTEFSTTNMQKTGLYGNVYDFVIDYQPVSTSQIDNIDRYLMIKMILYDMFSLIKKN